MREQRHYIRTASSALVEIIHPTLGLMEMRAKDLSDGGVFVITGNHSPLPVGTEVRVRIKRLTGVINREPVAMKVVHHQADGMGLMFV